MVRNLVIIAVAWTGAAVAGPERCNGFEGAKCAEIRQAAVAQGCLSPAQAALMTSVNAVPMCVGNSLVGQCSCGCFAPEARIAVGRGEEMSAEKLYSSVNDSVLEARVVRAERPQLAQVAIAEKMQGNESQDLIRLELANGRGLRLTSRHPVVLADGGVVTAREITRGSEVMGAEGEAVKVERVGRDAYAGKVYNFKAGEARTLVAETVIVGDLALQNALEEEAEGIRQRE